MAAGIFTRLITINGVQICPSGKFVTVEFNDATYIFHSQWLHDAQMDDGPYKEASNSYSCKTAFTDISKASFSGHGIKSTLNISWADGKSTQFPCAWLRLYAPMVAKCDRIETAQNGRPVRMGWDAATLTMPEISYTDLFPKISEATRLRVYEILAHESFPGILKVTKLPIPDVQSEREGLNTLVTAVLKQVFGSVFDHPRRGAEKAYNIASHHASDVQKGLLVPNYNTSNFLLPHVDQSFYQTHTRIVGLYILEGESDNSFVSGLGVLETLKEEHPELVAPLYNAPMALGRAGKMYAPTQYQGTTTTVITPRQGFPNEIYRFRWHPHYVGALLCPFDEFTTSLEAHRKYQEIMNRPSHQLKLRLEPGDMYLMDNYRVFHGRDRVLSEPRTCVGQSSPEQVVLDGWREALIGRLLGFMEEKWLIHMPLMQLYEMDKIVNGS